MATDLEQRVRLACTVPSLLAVAGRPRRGFTLIELLIAVALSTVIVVSAVACFQMVAKVVTTANALSTENGLLRSGFMLAMQDVDYWHSHADANPPYNKGFMRYVQRTDNGGTGTPENAWRRPFAALRIAPRTDSGERDPFPTTLYPYPTSGATQRQSNIFNADPAAGKLGSYTVWTNDAYWQEKYNRADMVQNPNMLLAHDSRSICRTTVVSPRIPLERINSYNDMFDDSGNPYFGTHHYGGYRLGYQRLVSGDYSLVSCTDMRDLPAASNQQRYPTNTGNVLPSLIGPTPVVNTLRRTEDFPVTVAAGTPPVITPVGTGTSTANPTYTLALPAVDIPLDKFAGQYQPLMWLQLWQRLGYYGLYEYMTPGTALMWSDRRDMTFANHSIPLPPYTYGGLFSPSGAMWYDYVLDGDYAFNLGNQDLATRMGERFIPSRPSGKNKNDRPFRSTSVLPLRPCWPFKDNGQYDQGDFDNYTFQFPFTIFLGTGEYDFDVNAERANMQMGWILEQGYTWMERGSMARSDAMSLSTTVWLPYNQTDHDRDTPAGGTLLAPTNSQALAQPLDYTSKPAQAPIMKTSIMRYGRLCGSQDITVTIVTVEDPITGKKCELTCMPFGTTYRGARQHWRLYSPALTVVGPVATGHLFGVTDDNCAGDYYDLAKGPYAP